MKKLLIGLSLVALAGCGGGSGGSATAPTPIPVTPVPGEHNCSTGDIINNSGPISIIQDCVDGNGNAIVVCKNVDSGTTVDCNSAGGNVIATPAPTP